MKIMVVGCEEIGCEIAKVFICNNHNVILSGNSDTSIEKGVLRVANNMENLVDSLEITEDEKNTILKRLCATTELRDAVDCDLVIEAIDGSIDTKKKLLKELDYICKRQTIFIINTPDLLKKDLSSIINRGDKVVGVNFLSNTLNSNQVIDSLSTSKETHEKVSNLISELN